MLIKPDFKFITFSKNDMVFKFLESGDIFEILYKDIMINMFNGTVKEGSLNNIYLRIYKDCEFKTLPLLGIKSLSKIYKSDNSLLFEGYVDDIKYSVKFTLDDCVWFYEVDVYGSDCEFDLLYCQDISIANKRACIINELYTSQYIDHNIIEGKNGFVVCSRQNQDQGGRFPYIEQGCIDAKVISYSTDQTQFFGNEYKLTDIPYCIDKDLEKQNYQFELAYIALQTEKIKLEKHKKVTFYALFNENHKTKVENLEYIDDVEQAFNRIKNQNNKFEELHKVKIKDEFGDCISSEKFTQQEVSSLYKNRKFEEYKDDELLSFFTDKHSHVVMREKEILCERPHGNIIINAIDLEKINSNIITSTNYMFGLFNCQVALGNTSLNKMLSVNRGLLNTLKNSGQRIYIKINGKFRMLTLAGIYEIGLNFSKWYYKIDGDVIIVESYVSRDNTSIVLNVSSKKQIEYEFIITNQLVIGDSEFENEFEIEQGIYGALFKPKTGSFLYSTHRDISYEMNFYNCKFSLSNDRIFYDDNIPRNTTLFTFKLSNTNCFRCVIFGSFEGVRFDKEVNSLEHERDKFNEFYADLLNGFKLSSDENNYQLDKLNEIVYFYTHDALIHFASPHGLEQSSGAAWGTRDVCQGPIELFSCLNRYELVRKIILEVFSHQFKENGQWPQWFMFDKYNMQQDDSHGDIIFWPLKVIGEYVLNTGDKSIFEEKVPYRSFPSCLITDSEKIMEHIKKAIDSIKNRFIGDTYLISYDGGDWDDTLQPINDKFKEKLISTWTMALAYKSLKDLHEVIDDKYLKEDLYNMFSGIKDDFLKYAIKDGVVSGFIYIKDDETIDYIIHPSDNVTNIEYRLLPLIRSIISEMISLEQAYKNEDIIEKHLTFSDGVRLMSMTPTYNGGIPKIFRRAEQASNVGREISLQYVHAHIRFIEAMSKLGKGNKAWEGLFTINPINIKDSVPNADYRQSNCYFSSSDGDFRTRYEFQQNFSKLKQGIVNVKGGWRIYSSGPGIYINQLISNVLGIRHLKDRIIFDPVVSDEFKELKISYKILEKYTNIVYKFTKESKVLLNGEEISFIPEKNIYGKNYKSLKIDLLKDKLKDNKNILEIFISR